MKKLSIYLIAIFFISAFTITSCKDKAPIEEIPDPAFTILADYLQANSMDLSDIIGTKGTSSFFVTKAPDTGSDQTAVDTWAANYSILDLRSATAFDNGHIRGATNVTLGNIITAADGAANRPLIVCYTGQTACFAVALLRLSGIDAVALKWGMSGWHSDFSDGYWDNVIGTDLAASAGANWNSTATSSVTFNDPELTETIEDGAALLDARIATVLSGGFKGVNAADVLASPTSYFVNNFFSDTHYTEFGHVAGAYRINPLSLAGGEYNNLDPSKDVVTYCYTGQTSAVITAYLRVLGFDAYSLKFGMNALSHQNAYWTTGSVANRWGDVGSTPHELPYDLTTK